MWVAGGMSALERWQPSHSHDGYATRLLDLAAMVIFFLIPVAFFVVGRERLRSGFMAAFTKAYWQEYPAVCLRMACWFLGVFLIWLLFYGRQYMFGGITAIG